MRLLKPGADGSFGLVSFSDRNVPPYAILSHTWSRLQDQEVTYKDVTDGTGSDKAAFEKLRFCAGQAREDELEYFWIDTCCIDKSNSSELNEAINSMFRWYQKAERCYVYLTDVSLHTQDPLHSQAEWQSAFCASRWHTRGWTVQELLAPRRVDFFSRDRVRLGDKVSLAALIYQTTEIPVRALRSHGLSQFAIEERLRWIRGRDTTKEEDMAYSLLGICGVYMPLIYGEGRDNAMRRLKKEVAESAGETRPAALGNEQALPSSAPLFTVPFPRDRDFVDRGDLFAQVRSQLAEPASRVALVGLGGVGKSQLAIEYAYRLREQSPQTWIFWVYGGTVARFREAFYAVAERLNLVTTGDHQTDPLEVLSRWLKDDRNGPWLMIVDNADDASVFYDSDVVVAGGVSEKTWPESKPLSRYLPRSPNGRVLITSRNEDLASRIAGEYHDVIKIGPMDAVESASLFRKKRVRQDEERDVTELLNAVGHIPLAITQAAAYVNRAGPRGSVKRYLQLYHQGDRSRTSLLRFDAGDPRRDGGALNSVLLTWQVSFQQIMRERPSAADLLSLMSFFHRQGIPEFALRDATSDWSRQPGQDPEFEFQEDLTSLLNYNLITSLPAGDMFEMHRLVQLSTQIWLQSREQTQRWQQAFLHALAEAVPVGGWENRETWRALFPHVEAIAPKRPAAKAALEDWARILYKAAWYAWSSGRYQVAERMAAESLAVDEDRCEDRPRYFLSSLGLLAIIKLDQGRYDEAEEMQRRALAGREETEGPEHPDTLITMGNLAAVLLQRRKFEEAEALYRRALNGKEKTLGHGHPDTVSSVTSLISVLRDSGKYEEAKELHRQTFGGREEAAVSETAVSEKASAVPGAGSLAMVFWHEGKYKEAEEEERRVLEGMEKTLGAEHPSTIAAVGNIASSLWCQGKNEEAEPLNRRALAGWTKALGPDHPKTLESASNLATVLGDLERYDEAETVSRQALEGRERAFGSEHPDTLTSASNLAALLRTQRKLSEAEEMGRRAMKGREKVLGGEHPDSLTSVDILVSILWDQWRFEEAEELSLQALEIRERTCGPEHPDTIKSIYWRAVLRRGQGDYAAAGDLFARALDGYKKAFGPDHEQTQRCSKAYDFTISLMNETAEADDGES